MPINKDDLQRLTNQCEQLLPGVSIKGLHAKLYEVLKEFFEDSLAWREEVEFQATAHVQEYTITLRGAGQPYSLIAVWDKHRFPVAAFMPEFGILQIVYPITSTPPTKWHLRVAKTIAPPTTSDGIPIAPSWVLGIYSRQILDGIVGNMMLEQNKSYSNPTTADYHLKRFRTGIQVAKTAANRANTVGAQSWTFPRNFRTNSQQGGIVTAWPGIGYGE